MGFERGGALFIAVSCAGLGGVSDEFHEFGKFGADLVLVGGVEGFADVLEEEDAVAVPEAEDGLADGVFVAVELLGGGGVGVFAALGAEAEEGFQNAEGFLFLAVGVFLAEGADGFLKKR